MRKLPLAIVLLCSALCMKGLADTVTLKDGTTVEGKIIQENDTQVTITVQATDSITDDKVIQKTDIAKVEKTAEDGIAFVQFKAWRPDPWVMLSPEQYKNAIAQLG